MFLAIYEPIYLLPGCSLYSKFKVKWKATYLRQIIVSISFVEMISMFVMILYDDLELCGTSSAILMVVMK